MSIGMAGGIVAITCWFAFVGGRENERAVKEQVKALKAQGRYER